jgi:glycosyltransferase involved in cell wall biosynthesis
MSLIETGLCRLPVLSTNVGLSGEILSHLKNSYICPVRDTACVSDGIKILIGDNTLRYQMAQNLFEDIKSRIGTKEEYVKSYVANLEEAAHGNL